MLACAVVMSVVAGRGLPLVSTTAALTPFTSVSPLYSVTLPVTLTLSPRTGRMELSKMKRPLQGPVPFWIQ